MADEAAVLAEAAKLPIEERAAHSNWKVRSAAYEFIKLKCSSVFDPSDHCLSEFVSVFPKASADGNAAALDKALEALQAFLEKASDSAASRIAGTVCSNIVSKSLGARPSTVAKGNDCLAAFVEVEQAEKVTTALVEGYSHKVPKVVVGALDATLFLVRSFGGRAMPAQQILKAMAGMFESKDAKARALVKEIVAELARWMGPELIRAALYEKMRDAQKADVEALLAELPAGRPKPERLTRKEAAKAAAAAAAATQSSAAGEGSEAVAAGAAAVAAVEEEPEQIDSYEFAEPKDIIPELKKDFWDGIVAAKWSERKAACTTLKELASYPRLANGDYGDVNRELKKIISKDSNIQVVAEAINCIAAICKGMRKDYRGASMTFCPVVLEKFKDKAAVVGQAAAEALEAMARYSISLVDVAEDVAAALAHQNPKVKESTLIWLAGCVPRETKAAAGKLVAGVVPAAVKCTDEGAPSIRKAAFNFLVQLALKAGSLGALEKGLAKMDEAKRKKLEEMLQEAAKARRAGGAAAAPAAAAAPSRASSSRSLRAPASGGPSPLTSPRSSTTGPPARPAASAATRSTAVRGSAASKPPAGAAGRASRPAPSAGAAGVAAAAAAADGVEDESALAGGLLNAHEAKSRLGELLGEELVAALADAQWKVRLEAMESVVAKSQAPEAADCVQTLVQGVAHLPGWDDKNFQVMSRQFEVIRCCAAYPGFGKTDALVAVMGATDKLGDLKLKEAAFQMLLAASEAVGPQLVASLLHKRAAAHKNPKVLTEAINWITLAIGDFLLPAFNVKALLGWAKEDLGSANAATRTAAVQMLGCLHTFLGPPLGDMVRADLKPALMATVEAEFAKQPQQTGFTAKRVSRAAAAASAAGGARKGGAKVSSAAAAAEEPPSMDDLLPRADISGQITGELLGKLTSANWKERKEGLDEVEAILAAAGGRIQPCVGDLMPALKGRFNDSNKNLIALVLALLAKLAKAMGRAIVREARPVLGPALRCLCDSKPFVRAAVVELLEAWASVAPCDAPFEELLEILPSPKCVSEGMQAAIAWMASVYSSSGSSRASSHDCIAAAVKAVAIGAGYKTVPVREAAGQLMEALISSVGVQAVQGAVQGLDKNLQKTAADALAKAGAAVGPGPAMPAAAAAAAGGSSRPGTASAASRPASRPGTAGSRSTAGGSGAASRPGTASSGAAVRSSVTASSSMGRGSVAASSAAGLAGAMGAGDEGPLLSVDRNKEERARKARFKSSKFEIRPEELQTLEAELGALAAPGLRANLFAKDFKKQILAADALRVWITNRQDDSVTEACVACLDLLLRWAVVRLAEGNTQTLVGVTGMLKALFDLLAEQGYRLSDAEVKVYMPGLVEKCGQPTPQMKAECRDLIRRVSTLYPATKVISFIQEGLNSKNNRTRVTCAEEIAYLVDKEGPRVYSGAKCDVLAALAKLVAESGKEIRAAALEALGVVYTIEGDAIMKRLGSLNGQQQGILGDRLKTVDRDLAKKGLTAGYRRAEFDAMRASISTDTATLAGAGGFDQPAAAAAGGGGYAAAGGYGGVGSSSFGANRARGDSSILAGVGAGAAGGASGYGAAAAGGLGSSQAPIPGLSSTAGLINLGGQGPADAAAAAGRGGFSRQPSAGLLATAEYNAASSQPMLLMTGAGAAAAAIPAQPALGSYQQQHQQQIGEAAAAAAAAASSRPSSALVTGLHVQPLQSFANSAEQRAEFDKCLLVLRGGSIDDVIEVMKLLCYELMDLQRSQAAAAAGAAGAGGSPQAQAVWSLLVERADELVQLLTGQTQQVFVAASASMRVGPLPPANCRACKYALNTLMNIFGSSALPAGLSQQTLSGLVRVLLMRLVDDHLGRQAEGEALLKALNVLMLKILENSNRNFTFSALLALLLDVPPELAAAGGSSADGNMQQQSALAMRWADLVVKCLIKSTKALPQVIQSIDLRGLLLSLHAFFEALGVEEIRRRSHADDKPLRMVKTILHELCKLKGTEIYKYTADIPQHGSASGADGKPVIFPYIDLNIQTLQGNGAIRSSMQQQQQSAATAAAPGVTNGSSNPVTPGRGLLAAAGSSAAGNGMRPAAAAPQTPGSAIRAQRDGIMAQLSAVFTRLSTQMQASSKDSSEKRAVLLDIYAISQEQGMPIDKLMAMYLPDTTPAFKAWIVAEMRRIDEEQQQPASQPPQQYAAQSVAASAEAPGALAGVYSSGATVAAPAAMAGAIGGPGGPTMEALKARMSQLQSEKTRILQASPTKLPAAVLAAAPVAAAPAAVPPAAIAAVGAAGMGPGSIAAAAAVSAGDGSAGGVSSGGGSGRNLQDLRSRMKGLAGL